MFHIVLFLEKNEVAVVPSSWMLDDGKKCWWPNVKAPSSIRKLVQKREPPRGNWEAFAIRSLSHFSTYDIARSKLRKAEDTSDLQSDVETRRKRIKPRWNVTDSEGSDSESILPQAPTLPAIHNIHSQAPTPTLQSLNASPQTPTTTQTQEFNSPHFSQSVTPSIEIHPSQHFIPQTTQTHSLNSHFPQPLTPSILRHPPQTPTHAHALNSLSSQPITSSLPRHPIYTQPFNTQYLEQPFAQQNYNHSASTHTNSTHSSQTCSCNTVQTQILKNIEKQIAAHTQMLQTHTQMLQQLLGHPVPSTSAGISRISASLPENFPVILPVRTFEDLCQLNLFLKEGGNFSKSVSYFASFGGTELKKTLHRLLPALIHNELAQQLNWKGRGQKHGFQQFKFLLGMIYHAAKVQITSKTTIDDIEDFLKMWFRFAGDRFGGRNKRAKNVE